MNIFTILNRGDSNLHEPSHSAILGYILDPNEDHGLRSVFLDAFIDMMQESLSLQLGKTLKQNFSLSVDLENEYDYYKEGAKKPIKRRVDIELLFRDKDGNQKHSVLIENKIKESAIQEEQLNEIYQAKKHSLQNSDARVSVVLIAPSDEGKKFSEAFDRLRVDEDCGDKKSLIYWRSNNRNSIQKVIREGIIQKEANGEIAPIYEYVKHTLKAFVSHLDDSGDRRSGSRNKRTRTADSARSGPVSAGDEKVISRVINGDNYEVIRFGHNNWKFKARRNGHTVKATEAFRIINDKLELGVNDKPDGKRPLDTYQLGYQIWQKLVEREQD